MNHAKLISLIALLSVTGSHVFAATPRQPLTQIQEPPLPQGIEVGFTSTGEDIAGRVADLIATAKKEVLVSQYALTDIRVLQALSIAVQPPRNVIVAVLLDSKPAIRNYDTPRYLRGQGIPVIFAKRGLTGAGWHNQRYIIIDRQAVIITSADLILAATRNTENIIVLNMPSVAAKYYNNWLQEAGEGQKLP